MNTQKEVDNGDCDVSHWAVMRCEEAVAPCSSPLRSWCFFQESDSSWKSHPFILTFTLQSNASTSHESWESVTHGIAVQLGQLGGHYKSDTNYPNDILKNVQNQPWCRLNSSIKGSIFAPRVWRPLKYSHKYIGSRCSDVSAVPPLSCS